MDIALWLELIIFILLMGFSGFFSSSETALFSLNQLQIEQMRRDENPNVSLIKLMLAEPRRLTSPFSSAMNSSTWPLP